LRFADIANYRAQRESVGPTWDRPEDDPHTERRIVLMQGLTHAIGSRHVRPWFQPQIDTLTVEVVEFAADFCAERVVASTERICSSGVSLSVDDFGQAVSSLARLNLFDVDELKIDRRFVSRMIKHRRDVAIVDLVVALADRLGLRLVAEGVERVQRVERFTPMAQPAAALSDAC
jgi:EAL domain-containing protein (putative c-di-GMP-specific phosphodiesterase class I)